MTDFIPITLAEQVRIYRQRMRLSQEEFAQKAGISRNALSMFERGHYNPTYSFLVHIADALDMKLNITLEDRSRNSPPSLTREELSRELFSRL